MDTSPYRLSRRNLLKLPALVLASAFAGLPIQVTQAAAPRRKVGVLTPKSPWYPALADEWLAGIRRGFDGAQVELTVVEAESGALRLAQQARALAQAGSGVVIGMGDGALSSALRTLPDSGATFVNSHLGARMHESEDGSQPHVTLGYWQANYALGRWLAQTQGRRAFLAMSFYESGWDSAYAFQAGFEAGGGSLAGTFVSDVPPASTHLPSLFSQIEAAKPDLVYALFSGSRARAFVRAYAQSPVLRSVPLAGSPFVAQAAFEAFQADGGGRAPMPVRSWDQGSSRSPFEALGRLTAARILGDPAAPMAGQALDVHVLTAGSASQKLTTLDAPAEIPGALLQLSQPRTGWTGAYLCA